MINVYVWTKWISTRNNEVILWRVYEGLGGCVLIYDVRNNMKISPIDPTEFSRNNPASQVL